MELNNLKKIGIKQFEKNYKELYNRCFKFNSYKNHNPISFLTNGYLVIVLYEKYNKNYGNKNKKINLDTYWLKNKKIKKGLFEADKYKASKEFLDKYHKFGIDPNNDILLYCCS